jgi:membrane protease YdiL (CAAX protease family)
VITTSAGTADGTPARSPLKFFALLFALSLPFWVAGAVFDDPDSLPMGLPVSAFQFVLPIAVAALLVHREEGRRGIGALLRRTFSVRRFRWRIWWVPVILLVPAMILLTYGLMPLVGAPLDGPHSPLTAVPALLAVFFVAAVAEEAGWMGYVLPPLQERWSALGAGVILGLVWAAWHLVGLVQGGRAPLWIAGQCLSAVALRVLMVWLFNNTGGTVLTAVVVHDLLNVSQSVFPNYPEHPAPAIGFGLVAAVTAATVAFLWGPRTLSATRRRR